MTAEIIEPQQTNDTPGLKDVSIDAPNQDPNLNDEHEVGDITMNDKSLDTPAEANHFPQEVVQKLSSITETVAKMDDAPSESLSSSVDDEAPMEVAEASEATETSSKVTSSVSPEFSFSVNPASVDTPAQYKNHISLRGKIVSDKNLFEECKEKADLFGTEVAKWQGKWGMNDSAFVDPNGVLSSFQYSVKVGQDLLSETNENNATVVVTGWFKVKTGLEDVEVEEKDVVLKIERASTGNASVSGSGENKYGVFKLSGFYNEATSELNCYREYLKAGIKPKPRKMKRKSAGFSKSPATKKTKADSLDLLEDDAAKRERKTPVKLKESLNMKTFQPKKESKSKSSTKSDKQAMLEMIEKLIQTDKERFFSEPVDPVKLQAPNYYDVIKRPMDLGTVQKNVAEDKYEDTDEMALDVRLVFNNAMLYNPKKHPVHSIAAMHLKLFEKDLKAYQKDKEKAEKMEQKKMDQKLKAKVKKYKPTNPQERVTEMKKDFELKQQQLMKDKKKLLSMFSSDSDDSSDSEDEELVRPAAPVVVQAQPTAPAPKKKKKKKDKGDMDIMRKTVAMMNSQLEMMQQLQSTSLQEIQRLNQELNETKQTAFSQQKIPPFMQQNLMGAYAGQPYMQPHPMATMLPPPTKETKPPKSKAKPLNYQQMSQLANDINKLSPQDIEDMVKLMRDMGANLGEDDELELDIENLAPDIQRQVQKFVSKKLAKAKSSADISQLRFDEF